MVQDGQRSTRVSISSLSIYDAPTTRSREVLVAEPSKLDTGISRTREVVWRVADVARGFYRSASSLVGTVQANPDLQHRLGIVTISGVGGMIFAGARAGRFHRSFYGLSFSGCAAMALWPQETKQGARRGIAFARQYYNEMSDKPTLPKVDSPSVLVAQEQQEQSATSHAVSDTSAAESSESSTSPPQSTEQNALDSSEGNQDDSGVTIENHGQATSEDNDMYANRSG